MAIGVAISQAMTIAWSNRIRGKEGRIRVRKVRDRKNCQFQQYPKQTKEVILLMTSIDTVSLKKIIVKSKPPYSTLKPLTSSLSLSGRSKGLRPASARRQKVIIRPLQGEIRMTESFNSSHSCKESLFIKRYIKMSVRDRGISNDKDCETLRLAPIEA